jgi:transposase-like protein
VIFVVPAKAGTIFDNAGIILDVPKLLGYGCGTRGFVMKSVLSDKHFHNEEAAYAFVEARVWPNGPVCPHCGGVERISKMGGKSTRIGAYKCYLCRKPFTVKIGTIFEASHVPMRHWLQAMLLMFSSKKGISSNQLHRTLGCTVKTAWFISHRIREAMRVTSLEPLSPRAALARPWKWTKPSMVSLKASPRVAAPHGPC